MMIKLLILLVSLTATVWLWGHWSFDNSAGLSLLLFANSLLLFSIVALPIYFVSKGKKAKVLFEMKRFKALFCVYVGLTLILCLMSFYGLMQYLLPLKVLLLAAYGFIKLKSKKKEVKN